MKLTLRYRNSFPATKRHKLRLVGTTRIIQVNPREVGYEHSSPQCTFSLNMVSGFYGILPIKLWSARVVRRPFPQEDQ